jgi:hypothetical protein
MASIDNIPEVIILFPPYSLFATAHILNYSSAFTWLWDLKNKIAIPLADSPTSFFLGPMGTQIHLKSLLLKPTEPPSSNPPWIQIFGTRKLLSEIGHPRSKAREIG